MDLIRFSLIPTTCQNIIPPFSRSFVSKKVHSKYHVCPLHRPLEGSLKYILIICAVHPKMSSRKTLPIPAMLQYQFVPSCLILFFCTNVSNLDFVLQCFLLEITKFFFGFKNQREHCWYIKMKLTLVEFLVNLSFITIP